MTTAVKIGLVGGGVSSLVGLAYLANHLGDPGTFLSKLTSSGGSQIQDNHVSSWKAKFIDFGAEIKSKVSSVGYDSGDATDDHVNKLREWCKRESEKSTHEDGYDTYFKLCSGKLNTVKARLVSEGLTPAKQDDDWKLIFLGNRHNSNFIDRFKGSGSTDFTKTTEVSNAYSRVKSTCESWMGGNLGPSDFLGDARKWCVKSVADTLGKRLGRATGFQKLSETDYRDHHNRWKDIAGYKTAIASSSGDTDEAKLRAYCGAQYVKTLTSVIPSYDTELKNTFNYCNKLLEANATPREITWQT